MPGFCTQCQRPVGAERFCPACGAAFDGDAVPPACGGSSSSTTRRVSPGDRFGRLVKRTATWLVRRKFAIAVVAVVVLAVAGGSYLWSHPGLRGGDPDAPVIAYFDALDARDGAAAAALTGESGPLWATGALVSGYTPPEHVTVVSVSDGAAADVTRREGLSYAKVTVNYSLDGVLVEQPITVSRDASGRVRDWSIASGAGGTLTVGAAGGSWKAAAMAVPATEQSTSAPPGVYEVEVTGGPLFTDVVTTAAVAGGDAGSGGNTLALRPKATVEVQRQVDAFADECAAAEDIDWSGCYWADDSGPVSAVDDAEWAVMRYPVVQLTVDGGTVAVSGTLGEATGSYRDDLSGPVRTIHADIYVGGEVTVEGGAIVWRPGPPPEGMPSAFD